MSVNESHLFTDHSHLLTDHSIEWQMQGTVMLNGTLDEFQHQVLEVLKKCNKFFSIDMINIIKSVFFF